MFMNVAKRKRLSGSGRLYDLHRNAARNRAKRALEAAGQRALAIGDVIVAANAFADAAWVAESDGRNARALDLVSRARLLANSPLIPDDARDQLRNRWEETGPQQ